MFNLNKENFESSKLKGNQILVCETPYVISVSASEPSSGLLHENVKCFKTWIYYDFFKWQLKEHVLLVFFFN